MFHHVPSPPVDRALTHRALSRSPEGPACSALANGEATSGGEKSGEAVEESGRCEGASTESTRQPSHRRSRRVNHPTGGQTCLFDSFCWGHDFSSHDVLGAGRPGSVNPKQNPSRRNPKPVFLWELGLNGAVIGVIMGPPKCRAHCLGMEDGVTATR